MHTNLGLLVNDNNAYESLLEHFDLVYLKGNHEFREDSGCRCIGSNVTLQCKVVGNSGWITWTGSALDCSYSGNEITFSFPDSFLGGRATKTCNSGEIIGQTLPVKNNNVYLSQLNVILSSYLIGRTVRCVYYVNATDHVLIGAVNLSSTTGIFHGAINKMML